MTNAVTPNTAPSMDGIKTLIIQSLPFEAIIASLIRQKDPAAEKLDEVLKELDKTVRAIDDEYVDYLSLYFGSDEENISRARSALLRLESGQSEIRMEEARGHSHKITNIYDKYLKRPIHDLFDPGEAEKLDSIFETLGHSDYTMLRTMESVTNWLKQEASQTLELLEDGDLKAANQRIKSARQSAKPEREKLTHAMAHLRRLQAKFIAEAETV